MGTAILLLYSKTKSHRELRNCNSQQITKVFKKIHQSTTTSSISSTSTVYFQRISIVDRCHLLILLWSFIQTTLLPIKYYYYAQPLRRVSVFLSCTAQNISTTTYFSIPGEKNFFKFSTHLTRSRLQLQAPDDRFYHQAAPFSIWTLKNLFSSSFRRRSTRINSKKSQPLNNHQRFFKNIFHCHKNWYLILWSQTTAAAAQVRTTFSVRV